MHLAHENIDWSTQIWWKIILALDLSSTSLTGNELKHAVCLEGEFPPSGAFSKMFILDISPDEKL